MVVICVLVFWNANVDCEVSLDLGPFALSIGNRHTGRCTRRNTAWKRYKQAMCINSIFVSFLLWECVLVGLFFLSIDIYALCVQVYRLTATDDIKGCVDLEERRIWFNRLQVENVCFSSMLAHLPVLCSIKGGSLERASCNQPFTLEQVFHTFTDKDTNITHHDILNSSYARNSIFLPWSHTQSGCFLLLQLTTPRLAPTSSQSLGYKQYQMTNECFAAATLDPSLVRKKCQEKKSQAVVRKESKRSGQRLTVHMRRTLSMLHAAKAQNQSKIDEKRKKDSCTPTKPSLICAQ